MRASGQASPKSQPFRMTWIISSTSTNPVAVNSIGLPPSAGCRPLPTQMERSGSHPQANVCQCFVLKVHPTLLLIPKIRTRRGKSVFSQTTSTSPGKQNWDVDTRISLTGLDFETGSVLDSLDFNMLNLQRDGPILKYMKETGKEYLL